VGETEFFDVTTQGELPFHRLVPRRLQQPQRTGTGREFERGVSSAGSPSIPTGMEGVSVVIVCCVVGHVATTPATALTVPSPPAATST
jgi:hypothetical protein